MASRGEVDEDRFIRLRCLRKHFTTAVQNINRLCEVGLSARRPLQGVILMAYHRQQRVHWCRQQRDDIGYDGEICGSVMNSGFFFTGLIEDCVSIDIV